MLKTLLSFFFTFLKSQVFFLEFSENFAKNYFKVICLLVIAPVNERNSNA